MEFATGIPGRHTRLENMRFQVTGTDRNVPSSVVVFAAQKADQLSWMVHHVGPWPLAAHVVESMIKDNVRGCVCYGRPKPEYRRSVVSLFADKWMAYDRDGSTWERGYLANAPRASTAPDLAAAQCPAKVAFRNDPTSHWTATASA